MRFLWEKEYTLRAGDFDKYNRMKPSAVLELFQDAAGQHAEEIHVGYDAMASRSYMWVLLRVKLQFLSNPKNYQKVVIKTWPLAPNRLTYRREYCMEDGQGESLVIGSSEWVIVHSEKRRLVADPNLYPVTEGFLTETMFEGKMGKVSDFEESGTPRIVNAGFSEIDVNHHVNNTKYANYVLDAVAPGEQDVLRAFQIDYRKEVLEGTRLSIYHKKVNSEVLAKGLNDNGEIMFSCRLEYKDSGNS